MNYSKLNLKIIGVTPLILHNVQLADPLNEYSKALSKISGKRSKTEADHLEMAKIEFHGSLYTMNNKVIIPTEMIEASIIDGAKKFRKGSQFKAGFFIKDHAELDFGQKLKADQLWKHREKYSIRAGVRVKTSRLFRTRPKFDTWSISFEIHYDPSLIDESELKEAIAKAGTQVGIGDWRPKHGRYILSEN